jgi:hypothetical protein
MNEIKVLPCVCVVVFRAQGAFCGLSFARAEVDLAADPQTPPAQLR